MNQQITRSTLFNFFSGHATPLQKKLVEEWLSQTQNTEKFYEWLEEWEREHPQFLLNTDQALEKYILRISDYRNEISLSNPPQQHSSSKKVWFGYAAAVAIVLAAAFFLGGSDFIQYQTYRTEYGELKELQLNDGSYVSLNSNSSLRVPRFGFGKATREVLLEGEAEFSVVHTEDDMKFLVHTLDQLEVEVLGTEFIIYSRARGSKVVLNKGKVLLRSLSDTLRHTLTIKPGDVVTIQKGVFKLKEKQPVQAHAAWKEHRFFFDHTPLKEIAFQLEENFGVRMQIPDSSLASRELTGTFEAANADELLQVLAKVLELQVSQRGKKVTVSIQ